MNIEHSASGALASALAEAAVRLELGDFEAGALAMTAAVAACSTERDLTPEMVADARRLFVRCQSAEAALRRKLVGDLGRAVSAAQADIAQTG
jgi:hypothetical protein